MSAFNRFCSLSALAELLLLRRPTFFQPGELVGRGSKRPLLLVLRDLFRFPQQFLGFGEVAELCVSISDRHLDEHPNAQAGALYDRGDVSSGQCVLCLESIGLDHLRSKLSVGPFDVDFSAAIGPFVT
jgi:hypothetical protein